MCVSVFVVYNCVCTGGHTHTHIQMQAHTYNMEGDWWMKEAGK